MGLDLPESERRSENESAMNKNRQAGWRVASMQTDFLSPLIPKVQQKDNRRFAQNARASPQESPLSDDAFCFKKNAESDILTTCQNILGAKKSHYWLLTLTKQPSFILKCIQN
jgi:hypothetical protein